MEKIAADLLLKGLAPEGFADSQPIGLVTTDSRERSEERRVGKECRSRWSPYH